MAGGLRIRKGLLLAKQESSYGVDASPAAADAVLAENVSFKAVPASHQRQGLNGFAADLEHVMGKIKWEISFDVELKGSGTPGTAPEFGCLLEACGLLHDPQASYNSYTPDLSQGESVTICYYVDGKLYKATGCRGSVSLAHDGVGGHGKLSFTFSGLYVAPSSASIPGSPVFDSTEPPSFKGGSFTLGGTAVVLSSFSMELSNEMAESESIVAAEGYDKFVLAKRAYGFSLTVEDELAGVKDFDAELKAGTSGAIDMSIGSVAGNQIDIDAPVAKMETADPGEAGGIRTRTLSGKLYDSSGNDAVTLKFY